MLSNQGLVGDQCSRDSYFRVHKEVPLLRIYRVHGAVAQIVAGRSLRPRSITGAVL